MQRISLDLKIRLSTVQLGYFWLIYKTVYCLHLMLNSHRSPRAAERIFIWGGGAKTKRGTIVSKRALTVHMQIMISLMC